MAVIYGHVTRDSRELLLASSSRQKFFNTIPYGCSQCKEWQNFKQSKNSHDSDFKSRKKEPITKWSVTYTVGQTDSPTVILKKFYTHTQSLHQLQPVT